MQTTNQITATPKSKAVSALCELLGNGDEADRCYASRALGQLGDISAIPDLIKRLHDEDVDVCIDAAEALGKMGATDAISELTETVDKDSDGEVKVSAVAALGMIGNTTNHNTDNMTDHRLQIINTLIKIAATRPQDINFTADDWDPWWDMQLQAVNALGQIGADQAATTIEKLLDDDDGQDIESELLKSLAFMGDSGEEILIKRLKQGAPRERRRIIRALGLRQSARTLRILKLALKEPDADVRCAALEALVAYGSAEQLPDMIKRFHDDNAEVRLAASKAVVNLSTTLDTTDGATSMPVNELFALLNDNDSAVRTVVLDILSDAALQLDAAQMAIVRSAMTDSSADVVAAACRLTGRCGDINAKADLLAFIEDTTLAANIRCAATQALGDLKQWDENIASTLTYACVDLQQPVRLAALNALLELDSVSKNTGTENTKPEVSDSEASDSEENDAEANKQPIPIPTAIDSILFIYKGEITPPAEAESDHSETKQNEESQQTEGKDAVAMEMETETEMAAEAETTAVESAIHDDANKLTNRPQNQVSATHVSATEADSTAEISSSSEVISTIDAITKTNVEVALAIQTDEKTTATLDADITNDEALKPYLELVKKNNEVGSWLKTRDTDASVLDDARRLATRIIGRSDDAQIVSILIEALVDNDSIIRIDAAHSLAEIYARNPQMNDLNTAIKALIPLLSSDDREQRIIGLRTIGTMVPTMIHRTTGENVIPEIKNLLDDKDSAVCIQAITSLGNIVDSVVTGAVDNDDVASGKDINNTLCETIECFSQLLDNNDPGIRIATATSLAPLIKILHHNDDQPLAADTVKKITHAGFENNGDQARILGKILKNTLPDIASSTLLNKLAELDTSAQRRFAIEMLEEIFK